MHPLWFALFICSGGWISAAVIARALRNSAVDQGWIRRPPADDVGITVDAAKAREHNAKIKAQLDATRGIADFNRTYDEFGQVVDVTRRPAVPSSYWLPFANGAINRSSGADRTGAAAHSPEEVCNAVGHLMVWGVPACFRCKEIPE